jgi:regulator of sigma E protease
MFWAMQFGRALSLRVAGPSGERTVELEPERSQRSAAPRVGIAARCNYVKDVRAGPLTRDLGIRPEDRIVRVGARDILRDGDFERALAEAADATLVRVRRGSEELDLGPLPERLAERIELAGDLFVTRDPESTHVIVTPGEPAALAGLMDLDRVMSVDGSEVRTWADVTRLVRRAGEESREAVFSVDRTHAAQSASPRYVDIAAVPSAPPVPDYGFALRRAQYTYRSPDVVEALRMGALSSWRFLADSWLTIRQMLLQRVSPDKMGGIIAISAISYSLAEEGWTKLFFFLCVLSLNLAFLNVLPIPVLDGGHLFFLIVEKLKGSPVSTRVMAYSQMVGVVLLLSLMVYVTYNDLVTWVFERG